jgi:hypothetical protein
MRVSPRQTQTCRRPRSRGADDPRPSQANATHAAVRPSRRRHQASGRSSACHADCSEIVFPSTFPVFRQHTMPRSNQQRSTVPLPGSGSKENDGLRPGPRARELRPDLQGGMGKDSRSNGGEGKRCDSIWCKPPAADGSSGPNRHNLFARVRRRTPRTGLSVAVRNEGEGKNDTAKQTSPPRRPCTPSGPDAHASAFMPVFVTGCEGTRMRGTSRGSNRRYARSARSDPRR